MSTSNASLVTDHGITPFAFAFVLLVVLSGYTPSSSSPPVVDAALGAPSTDASDGDNGAASAAVGGIGSSTLETRPVDTVDNPWGHAPVVVGADAPADDRDYTSFVEPAVDYWRTSASAVAYDPAFVMRPNSSDPGVTISVVERIDGCGDDTDADAVDCVSLLGGDDPTTPTEPVTMVVTVGCNDETTQTALKYESGHLLGLTHDNADVLPVLSEHVGMMRLPEPDVGERELPFRERTVAVCVDPSSVSPGERATHEAKIDHALSYYEGGTDGVAPTNLSFGRVSNLEMADVTLSVSTFRGGGSGAHWRWAGVDADDNVALEWYTGDDLTADADFVPSLVGWYVGAGPGYLFTADERADLPPPFRDDDPADDRAWYGLVGETVRNVTTPVMTPWRTQEFPSVARE